MQNRSLEEHLGQLTAAGFVTAAEHLREHMAGSRVTSVLFRGDNRADQLSEIRIDRLESGAGIYFTDNAEIASNYAEGKSYLVEDASDYGTWFQIRTAAGTHEIRAAGKYLSRREHDSLTRALEQALSDPETGGVAYDIP
jgi:hypothetical protein